MTTVMRKRYVFRPLAWALALLGTILGGVMLSTAEASPAPATVAAAPAVPAAAPLTPNDMRRAQYFPPLGFEHFRYSTICVADHTVGDWYPDQITTIINGVNAGTQRVTLWDAKGGSQCSGFESAQRLQVTLVAAADANKYTWCAKTYGATNNAGEWVYDPDLGFPTRIYYNYYKSACGADGLTGRRNTLSGVILEALGLERYYGGSDYTVENIERVNIPWPTPYDYLSLNRVY